MTVKMVVPVWGSLVGRAGMGAIVARAPPGASYAGAMQTTLRPATPDDATTISALAIQVYLDTYAEEGIRPDVAREALRECAAEAFDARLREPQRRIVLAERDGALLGFAELSLAEQAAPAGGVAGAELIRLYIQPAAQRTGLGRRLIRAAEALVAEAGLPALWLTAWDGNHRALAFYAREGYADVGATTFSFEGVTVGNRVLARLTPTG